MKNNIFTLIVFALFSITLANSQVIERTNIVGEINVPQGDDAGGISVYNLNTQQGVVTNNDGIFKINVAPNDRLRITALQFTTFTVVITEKAVKDQSIILNLNPVVNQLDSVIINPYGLSGAIDVDINRVRAVPIKTSEIKTDYRSLEFDYNFQRDGQSSREGSLAEEVTGTQTMKNGLNFVNLFKLLLKKEEKESIVNDRVALGNFLRERMPPKDLSEYFNIPEEKAEDFLYYVQQNGVKAELLEPDNEMLFLEFLYEQSIAFKNTID